MDERKKCVYVGSTSYTGNQKVTTAFKVIFPSSSSSAAAALAFPQTTFICVRSYYSTTSVSYTHLTLPTTPYV